MAGPYYLKSTVATELVKNTAYTLGQRIVPAVADTGTNYLIARKYVWECTTAGTSDASVWPTWNASYTPDSDTETSGTAVFTCRECTTLANAAKYAFYLANRVAAGETVWISDNHAESVSGTSSWAGTKANPVILLCGDDSSEPPTALATTASSTGTAITWNGSHYTYGMTLIMSGSGGLLALNADDEKQVYEKCHFNPTATGTTPYIALGYHGDGALWASSVDWRNCTVQFPQAASGICVAGGFTWSGGSITLGTAPTSLIKGVNASINYAGHTLVENCDLSNMGSYLVDITNTTSQTYVFRNCKLKTGWAAITGTDRGPGWKVTIENCSLDDTSIPVINQYHECYGSVREETTIKVTTGGASDGTNTYSWKMTCDADCKYPSGYLATPEIAVWNTTVGSAVTLDVEINHDSQGSGTSGKMTDADIWLEVRYLGTVGSPLGKVLTDAAGASTSAEWGSVLTTPTDQTDSAVAWSGTGGWAGPEPQKLSVTVTPQEIGYIQVRVCCAKTAAVVYVDPKIAKS